MSWFIYVYGTLLQNHLKIHHPETTSSNPDGATEISVARSPIKQNWVCSQGGGVYDLSCIYSQS